MPMGLVSAGPSMQRFIDLTLSGLACVCCLAYIDDDVIVYASTFNLHLKPLHCVLAHISEAGLKIKPGKSLIAQMSVGFLCVQ